MKKSPFQSEIEFLKKRISDLEAESELLVAVLPQSDENRGLFEAVASRELTFSDHKFDSRVALANEVLHAFGSTGRELFSYKHRIGQFVICGGKVAYQDPWKNRFYVSLERVPLGSGCLNLLLSLADFIKGRGKLRHHRFSSFGYGASITPIIDLMVKNGVMESNEKN